MIDENCPITKRKLDCQSCKVIPEDKVCPYMQFDECIENALKTLRGIVEKEMRNEVSNRNVGG